MMRPEKDEYAEFYETYVSLVPEKDIVEALDAQTDALEALFSGIDENGAMFAYSPDKWTIKEVIGHLIDGERIFCYRALRIARGDKTPLEGFEQDEYVASAGFNNIPFEELCAELFHLRAANIVFFRHLKDENWNNRGTASGFAISVRALAFIMVGHIRHHVRILNERYLTQ